MEKKEEARIKGKKIQNSKFKNLSASWRIQNSRTCPPADGTFPAPDGFP